VHSVAGHFQVDSRLVVELEAGSVGVIAIAVGLDDQALLRPVEVHALALDEDVHLRQPQALALAEREEVDLGWRHRVGEPRINAFD